MVTQTSSMQYFNCIAARGVLNARTYPNNNFVYMENLEGGRVHNIIQMHRTLVVPSGEHLDGAVKSFQILIKHGGDRFFTPGI